MNLHCVRGMKHFPLSSGYGPAAPWKSGNKGWFGMRRWHELILKVPSKPSHSVIPWFLWKALISPRPLKRLCHSPDARMALDVAGAAAVAAVPAAGVGGQL